MSDSSETIQKEDKDRKMMDRKEPLLSDGTGGEKSNNAAESKSDNSVSESMGESIKKGSPDSSKGAITSEVDAPSCSSAHAETKSDSDEVVLGNTEKVLSVTSGMEEQTKVSELLVLEVNKPASEKTDDQNLREDKLDDNKAKADSVPGVNNPTSKKSNDQNLQEDKLNDNKVKADLKTPIAPSVKSSDEPRAKRQKSDSSQPNLEKGGSENLVKLDPVFPSTDESSNSAMVSESSNLDDKTVEKPSKSKTCKSVSETSQQSMSGTAEMTDTSERNVPPESKKNDSGKENENSKEIAVDNEADKSGDVNKCEEEDTPAKMSAELDKDGALVKENKKGDDLEMSEKNKLAKESPMEEGDTVGETEDSSAVGPDVTPAEENSTASKENESVEDANSVSENETKMEVEDGMTAEELARKEAIAECQLEEYQWPSDKTGDYYMIQEQVSDFLHVLSFKRKYPELTRRNLDIKKKKVPTATLR